MNQPENNYRDHVIITSYSGPTNGPWLGNYSIWCLDEDQKYIEVLNGFVKDIFNKTDDAVTAATEEAQTKLDGYLDKDIEK